MSGFSLLEKQILALHYNGSYLSNFDFKDIAEKIGIELDLADREKILKNLIKKANEENKFLDFVAAMTQMLNDRIKEYNELAAIHPKSKDIIAGYIQKTRSTIMLLQQRARTNPYE